MKNNTAIIVALFVAGLFAFAFLHLSDDQIPDEDRYAKLFPIFIGAFIPIIATMMIILKKKRYAQNYNSPEKEIHTGESSHRKQTTLALIFAVLLLLGLAAFFINSMDIAPDSPGYSHLKYSIIVLALIFLIFIGLVVYRASQHGKFSSFINNQNARQILDQRYARGEITDSEYRSKLEELNR